MNHPHKRFLSLLLVLCLMQWGIVPALAEASPPQPDSTVLEETNSDSQEQPSINTVEGTEEKEELLALEIDVREITATGAEIAFTPQGMGEIFYIILEASERAPDAEKIRVEGGTAPDNRTVAAVLAPGTQYIVYGLLINGSNLSPVATVKFTTGQLEEDTLLPLEEEPAGEGEAPLLEEEPAGEGDAPLVDEEPIPEEEETEAEGEVPVVAEEPAGEDDVPLVEEEPAVEGDAPLLEEEPAGEVGLEPMEEGPAFAAAMLMPMEENTGLEGEPFLAISVSNITETGAEIAFTTQGEGEIRYLVLEAQEQAPDAAVLLSSGATAQDNRASLVNLTSGTEYAAYAVLIKGDAVPEIVSARFTSLTGAPLLSALASAYDPGDVAAINKLVELKGGGYSKDDPAHWDFVTWNGAGRAVNIRLSINSFYSILNVAGLTALEQLDLSGSRLVTINISGLTALTKLNCSGSNLTLLDLSGLPALDEINLSESRIFNLDADGLTALKSLDCAGRNMSGLYLSGLTALETLDCSDNDLSGLNACVMTALKFLDCSTNRMDNLNVSGLTALEYLDCSANRLPSLNMSGLAALKKLDCHDNNITGTFSVSGMTALSELDCGYNSFTGALNVSGMASLKILRCPENQFTSLTVNGLTALNELNCANNKLTSLNVGGLTSLEKLNCFGNDLTSLDVHTLTALKSMECSDNGLTGTLDVSVSTALEQLACFGNSLTGLKLVGLTKLKKLNCSFNNLSGTLDLSGLTALNELECFKNKLTGLNVSGLTALTYLGCSTNSLTGTLNVSGLTALDELNCSNNNLSALNVSGLTAIRAIQCYSNNLTSLNVSGLSSLYFLNCSSNSLNSLNLSGATELEWLDCSGNQLSTFTFSGILMIYLRCQNNYLASKEAIVGLNEGQLQLFEFLPQNTPVPTPTPTPSPTPTPTPAPTTPLPAGITLNRTEITIAAGQTVQTLAATVSPKEADGTVIFASGNTSVATVSANGSVTGVNAGSTVINVSTINGLTRVCIVTVVKAGKGVTGITVSRSAVCFDEGKNWKLTAKIIPRSAQNRTITWSSDNPAVARVNSKGKVYGISPGVATITATASSGICASCTVTVNEVFAKRISLSKRSAKIYIGSGLKLTARITPSNARNKTIAWASGNPAVATVDANGYVQSISVGTAVITATTVNGLTASCRLTVKPVLISRITLSLRRATVTPNQQFALSATVAPGNATNRTVSWFSSKPKVATVDQNGVVTSIAAGKATITCIANDGSRKKATCTVTVK